MPEELSEEKSRRICQKKCGRMAMMSGRTDGREDMGGRKKCQRTNGETEGGRGRARGYFRGKKELSERRSMSAKDLVPACGRRGRVEDVIVDAREDQMCQTT